MKIYNKNEIANALKKIDLIKNQKQAFVLYSRGRIIVPTVGEMVLKRTTRIVILDVDRRKVGKLT